MALTNQQSAPKRPGMPSFPQIPGMDSLPNTPGMYAVPNMPGMFIKVSTMESRPGDRPAGLPNMAPWKPTPQVS